MVNATGPKALPVVFELALTYGAGGPRAFGYLPQGVSAGSVPASLRELTRTTLELFLEAGAPRQHAELFVDLIACAFPNVAQLQTYQGSAQAMIAGYIPRPHGLGLKAIVEYCRHCASGCIALFQSLRRRTAAQ